MRLIILALSVIFFSGAAWAETITIDIKSFKFNGANVTVSVGDTIVWLNHDGAPHTATAKEGLFNTGTLKKGKSGEVTFTAAGTFDYFCKFHRNMKGRIIVK